MLVGTVSDDKKGVRVTSNGIALLADEAWRDEEEGRRRPLAPKDDRRFFFALQLSMIECARREGRSIGWFFF